MATTISSLPQRTYEPLTISAIVRRGTLLAICSLAFILTVGVENVVLRSAIPLFILLIVLQVGPALWPRNVDACAPPVVFGVGGLITALGTTASLVTFLDQGDISLAWVGPLSDEETSTLVTKVLLGHCLGTAAYYYGFYHSRWGANLGDRMPKVADREWVPQRLAYFSLAVGLIFVGSYAYFQNRVGVSLLDPTQLQAGKAVWREDGSSMTWMLRGIQLGVLPGFLYFTYSITRPGWIRTSFVVAALAAIGYLTLRLGQRGVTIIAFVPPLIVFHYLRRRVPVGLFIVALFITLFASNLMLTWRSGGPGVPRHDANAPVNGTISQDVEHNLLKNDSERQRFHVSAFLFEEFPKNRNYLWGESWLGLLVMPIPRLLWPNKWDAFIWRDSAIMLVIVGVPNPTPLLPLLYINFSWLGLVFGPLLWGIFHRGVYEWMLRSDRDPTIVLYYTMIIVYFSPTPSGVSSAIQYVLPLWLGLRLITRPRDVVTSAAPTPVRARPAAVSAR